MDTAKRRQWFLLGIAAGAVLAALLVIPLAVAVDNRLNPEEATPTDGPAVDAAAVARGKSLFVTCSACHGTDAMGIDGLGKTLVGSDFVNDSTDAELVAFVNVGRAATDPANTTGVDMPPKGNNAALTDDDIGDIVAYIRSLN